VNVHLILTSPGDEIDHMPVFGTRIHSGGFVFFLLLEQGVRHYQVELVVQSQYKLAIGVTFPYLMFANDHGPVIVVTAYYVIK